MASPVYSSSYIVGLGLPVGLFVGCRCLFLQEISGEGGGVVAFSGDSTVRFIFSLFKNAGLDFFLVRILPEIFCFPCAFSGDCVGGIRSLAVDVGRLEHEGVSCGWFGADEVFFDASFCVGSRIHRELISAGYVEGVCSIAELVTNDMDARGRGIVLSLRSGSDDLAVIRDCFVRSAIHLFVFSSWCSFLPLPGLLLVDWVLPVRRPATEPGDWMDCPGRSTGKWHAFSVLLTGFKDLFVDLGSGREFHPEFFFIAGDGEGSACGSDGRRRQGSLGALVTDFYIIFFFHQECLRGWM